MIVMLNFYWIRTNDRDEDFTVHTIDYGMNFVSLRPVSLYPVPRILTKLTLQHN